MPRFNMPPLRQAMLALAVSIAFAPAALADPLILQGSSTLNRQLLEPHKAEIEAQSGHRLTVIMSKTRPGLIALLEGRAHIAMISGPLEVEVEALKKALPEFDYDRLQTHAIMATRIAVAVHPSNRVRKLSLQQLRSILRGEVSDWEQVGGEQQPLRLVLVGGGGGVTATAQTELLDGQTISGPHVLFVKTGLQVVQVVEQEPSAVGIGQSNLIKQRGVPEVLTERPIQQTLSMVTLGQPTPAMQAVIDAARIVAERNM